MIAVAVPAGAWPLVDAATMRGLDRHTIETLGVPGALLMESAGRAVAEAALAARGPGGAVIVVAGSGSNGGDGLVAGRHVHQAGAPVRIWQVGEASGLRGDAAANLARARAVGVPIDAAPGSRPGAADVVVDALFGTGLARPVEGAVARAIAWIAEARARGARVVAVDLPSGLDADTGQPLGAAVTADVTVTCGLPKLGLALEPGRSLAGHVLVARIGIADRAPGAGAAAWLLTRAAAAAALPPRPRAGHKGSFGHVLVVAGSRGKAGAAALAARGALRAGAGLITVACPGAESAALQAGLPEAMTAPLASSADGEMAHAAVGTVLALAAARDVVALGPGLGTSVETAAVIRDLVDRLEQPLVLDADALTAVAGRPELLKAREATSILTPHPGEAARFVGLTPTDVNRDRVGVARTLAERTRAVVVLKGAATVIAAPDGRLAVCPTGGAALGTGGTGDVLCGVVAGLLAQGLEAFEAAGLAAYLHGFAGDRWQARHGAAGLRASELADGIPEAWNALRESDEAGNDGAGRAGGGLGREPGRDGFLLPFPGP